MKIILYSPLKNKLSINALAGAMSADEELRKLSTAFPSDPAALDKALAETAGEKTVAGFSFFSSQAWETAKLARAARKKYPALTLVAGGAHPSGAPEATLRLGFDAVCVGEGEKTFTEFLRRQLDGKEWRGLEGMAFLENGKFKQGKRRPRINLDDYPPFSEIHGRYGIIEITRGCPNACKFCQTSHLHGLRHRHRSVETILGYARLMHNKGMSDFRAVTPDALSYGSDGKEINYAALEKLLAGLHKILKPRGKIFFGSFPSEVRPEHVTKKAVALVVKYADNDNLVIGAQSASPRMLKLCGRGHSAADIFRAAEITLKAGLRPNMDFIFRLPGETEADARLSLAAMRELTAMGARIHAHTFMPLPGTAYAAKSPAKPYPWFDAEINKLNARGAVFGDWREQAKQKPSHK